MAAFESAKRDATNFARLPASDGRFGPDPYRLLALPDGRFAGLLRGADQLVTLDETGERLASTPAPHDPTDLALRGGELLVVGTGAAEVARYDLATLAPLDALALPDALAPRAIAASAELAWVADEGLGQLHELRSARPGGALELRAVHDYCRGPLQLRVHDQLVLGNCLLEHRVRVDRVRDGALETLAELEHDGPIWSIELGPDRDGARLLALTGVEDHPLERRDGGFGYIDSYVYIYELRSDEAGVSLERRAAVDVSSHGVVTPKWSRWLPADSPTLILAGYATAPLLTLTWTEREGFGAPPQAELRAALPGTSDAVLLANGELLAADPLLDRWLRLDGDEVRSRDAAAPEAPPDRRSFEERVGEALVFTTAIAPWNTADGKRSRFTCETCHFEGRVDGRVHFTGREREGAPVHAVTKPLLGLFPNRPHFTRALDRSTTDMIDNEFAVANRFSGHDPWFELGTATLDWLDAIPGWPAPKEKEALDGELLRRALFRFLVRFSTPSHPATRGREDFDEREAAGARLFAEHCEGCHQARLSTDEPGTRVALGPEGELEPWRALIFGANGPLVWGSERYARTKIEPWVHDEGARVSSLRRLYLKWPYFTNGGAESLAAVLEGVRLSDEGADHDLGPVAEGERGLDEEQRAALLAFLRLL